MSIVSRSLRKLNSCTVAYSIQSQIRTRLHLNRTSFRVRPSRSTILRLLSSSAKASNTKPIYIRNSFKQTSYPLGSSEKRARELQEPQRYNSFKGELSVSLQTQEEVSCVCPWSVRPVPVGSRVELESESTTAAHPGKPQAQAQAVCGSVLYLYGTEPSTHATIASTSSKRAHRESCPVSSAHLLPLFGIGWHAPSPESSSGPESRRPICPPAAKCLGGYDQLYQARIWFTQQS